MGAREVEIDKDSGFCFGVVNAIRLAEQTLARGLVFALGDIVHNRLEMERLEQLGLRTITHNDLERGMTVLIRAHGEPPSTYVRARELGATIIDATCPVVAALQRTVVKAHAAMSAVGGQVVILGKRGHAEVVGLTGQIAERPESEFGAGFAAVNAASDVPVIVIESEADLAAVDFEKPVYFLSQTTQSLELFGRLSEEIRRRAAEAAGIEEEAVVAGKATNVTVHDTICRAVAGREQRLGEFAARHGALLFVSGRKSSNGRLLFEACRRANPRSHMVEDETELRPEWLEGVASVGVCGATSTPAWVMDRVANSVK